MNIAVLRSAPKLQPKIHRPKHPGFRIAGWIAAGLAVLILLVATTTAIVLHTTWFHNYVLLEVQKQASKQLDTKVELQNFTLHLSKLSLDLYGLTVHGAAPYANPPLLQVEHLEVGVQIVSVLHKKWYLSSLRIDRPVAKVFTDAHGISNIPKLKSSGSGSSTSVFDLGVRHAVLANGEVYFNDKQSVISADLHDLEFRAAFDRVPQKYSGELSYSDGHLSAGSFAPLQHNFDAQFEATPTTFHLTQAKLSSGQSQVVLTAVIENYNQPHLQAHYEAILDGAQARQIVHDPSVPTGLLRASGSVQYQASANRPLLEALVLNGTLSSRRLDVQTPQFGTRIDDLAADYTLAHGNARVRGFHARLFGGELNGTATMIDVAGNSHSSLDASLHGVSLADLRRAVRASSMPRNVFVAGVLNADANATWGKTFDNLEVQANTVLKGQVSKVSNAAPSSAVIPVNSAIHATYLASSKKVSVLQSFVRTPQTSLTMNGVVSNRSSLAVRFRSNDLSELETAADIFRTSANPAQALGLAGTASFDGLVHGSTSSPQLEGQLVASNVHLNGTEWRSLSTKVTASPSLVSLQNADLKPVSQGRIMLNASAGLKEWSFTKSSSVQIQLGASQLDISNLAKAAGLQMPVTGILGADVRVHGTALRPVGQGNVSLTRSKVYGEPVQSAELTFAGIGDEVRGNLAVRLPAGNLQSKVTVRPQQKSYSAQLVADGIRLEQLQTVSSHNIDVKGAVNLHASGEGTFENPELQATLQSSRLDVQKATVTGLNLQLNVANHVGTAVLASEAMNSSIRGNAKVNLTGDYAAETTLDTQTIPLQPILAIYAPSQAADLRGETELHATLRGPLKNTKLLEAHLTIPKLTLAYSNTVNLAAASPIHVDYKDGTITVQRAAIRGTDTDLQFQGSVPTSGNARMSLLLLGTVNLQLAQLFDPDVRSSGELKFNINSYGATKDPNVQGQIEIVDVNFASEDLPLALQHGNGVLSLTKDRLNITTFQGNLGGGTLSAQGGVAYRPAVQFALGVSAKGVRMLYPQGMREGVNADLRLSGTTENAMLGGQVQITDLSFTPAFDLSNFMNQLSGGVAAPPTQGFSQNVQLNLAVHSVSNLNLVSRTLSVGGSANLQVRGTAAQPVILGRVNLNDGDIILNGNRFVLNGGTIQFVNPVQTEPVVNLAVSTAIQQYNISMRFNGPIDQLRTSYSSDPSLPAADIINLLAFGQTTEANAANPVTPANQAAESLLASQVSSQITSRVSKIAGISQLSINPVLAGGSTQGPPGANITIQQRVTGNLFITFSSNVASTQNQVISGQYQLSPRVAVSATKDQNGGFGFDTLIKKTW
ncbi:MAG TPA: translocation/assembly module TamB domain-containing protein [Acidobacteriaceae bacterium]